MTAAILVFLALTASTFMLTGLIWTIQCVHYPGFRYVVPDVFVEFEAFHQRGISVVVVPLMLVELGASVALLAIAPPFLPLWWIFLGLALVVALWVGTFTVQVPLHRKLSQGYDGTVIRKLTRSNWFRTVVWTLRSALVFYGMWLALIPTA